MRRAHIADGGGSDAFGVKRQSQLLFFFNHPATTEIYTLSLHDALPISNCSDGRKRARSPRYRSHRAYSRRGSSRSEEHTSELQSLTNLVCRLLLEKKNLNAQCPILLDERWGFQTTHNSSPTPLNARYKP